MKCNNINRTTNDQKTLKLANKNPETAIAKILNMLRDIKENMNINRKEIEDKRKNQMKHLQKKNESKKNH